MNTMTHNGTEITATVTPSVDGTFRAIVTLGYANGRTQEIDAVRHDRAEACDALFERLCDAAEAGDRRRPGNPMIETIRRAAALIALQAMEIETARA